MGNAKSSKKHERFVPEDAARQYERDMAAAGRRGEDKTGNSKDEYDNPDRHGPQVGSRSRHARQTKEAAAATAPRMDPALQGFAESLKKKQRRTPARAKKRIILGQMEQLPGTLRHGGGGSPGGDADPTGGSAGEDDLEASVDGVAGPATQPGFLQPHAAHGRGRPRHSGARGS